MYRYTSRCSAWSEGSRGPGVPILCKFDRESAGSRDRAGSGMEAPVNEADEAHHARRSRVLQGLLCLAVSSRCRGGALRPMMICSRHYRKQCGRLLVGGMDFCIVVLAARTTFIVFHVTARHLLLGQAHGNASRPPSTTSFSIMDDNTVSTSVHESASSQQNMGKSLGQADYVFSPHGRKTWYVSSCPVKNSSKKPEAQALDSLHQTT
jgi:hypothetical protein